MKLKCSVKWSPAKPFSKHWTSTKNVAFGWLSLFVPMVSQLTELLEMTAGLTCFSSLSILLSSPSLSVFLILLSCSRKTQSPQRYSRLFQMSRQTLYTFFGIHSSSLNLGGSRKEKKKRKKPAGSVWMKGWRGRKVKALFDLTGFSRGKIKRQPGKNIQGPGWSLGFTRGRRPSGRAPR